MKKNHARMSLGLPVYNGEQYLEEAIESVLNQTYADFELILCDNASTDRTREICETRAAMDGRIRYHRSEVNRGAAPNFNYAFRQARGEFFKWVAHDDLIAPTFLERCVEVLDRDPGVVLCYSRSEIIDDRGNHLEFYDEEKYADSENPVDRFRNLMLFHHRVFQVFGVIRAGVLARTGLIGSYTSSDRVLLGELALHGRFHQIPEYLFISRRHGGQSGRMYPRKRERMVWFAAEKKGKVVFPNFRYCYEGQRASWRAGPGVRCKLVCSLLMVRWALQHWRELFAELRSNARLMIGRMKAVPKKVFGSSGQLS